MHKQALDQMAQTMRELIHIENIKGRIKERDAIIRIIDVSMNYAKYDASKTIGTILRYLSEDSRAETLKEIERLENERAN